MRRVSFGVMAAVMAAVLVVVWGPPAQAGGEEHCVVEVVGEKPNGELRLSKPRCHPSFADAMLDASDGLMQLSADVASDVVFTDEVIGSMASTFALGIHYDGFGGSGSSITVVGSSCTGGWWNTTSSWDNRISSSYNGCSRLTHWDSPNKRGSYQSTYGSGSTDDLSYMSNRAESVSYH